MASTTQCLASLARLSLTPIPRPLASSIPGFLAPSLSQARYASARSGGKKGESNKKQHKSFKVYKKTALETYSLCDAIRYCRAVEVGQSPTSVKYDLAVKLVTLKRGHILRNRIRLPYPVKTDIRIAVICKEGTIAMAEAKLGGAIAVGEDEIFNSVKDGSYKFNRLICHTESLASFQKANLGRILGPKGLVPSAKTGTVTSNVRQLMRELAGADEYREREGVIRLAVGQLGFTPEMVGDNIKALVASIKKANAGLESAQQKSIDDIVFSSTHGPGFSLSGAFSSTDEKVTPEQLATPM